jgi:hypothetical protein
VNVLPPLPSTFVETRDALHRVAVHVVARARQQAAGRFGLRVTPGGFGTPELGDELVRVRVDGALLVRESGGVDGARSAVRPIRGASLAELADFAAVDLSAPLDVGHDTPPLGDVAVPLVVDPEAAAALGSWYVLTAGALDAVVAGVGPDATPTMVQLWPEHFDAALDLAAAPDRRVNLGGSPGDGFHDEPYLYVGPWTADRPGDQRFWNAPFGAVLGYATLAAEPDPRTAAVAFFDRGLAQLAR